jgi:hypothetical protein
MRTKTTVLVVQERDASDERAVRKISSYAGQKFHLMPEL